MCLISTWFQICIKCILTFVTHWKTPKHVFILKFSFQTAYIPLTGLKHINKFSAAGWSVMRVEMEDIVGYYGYAQYSTFHVGDASSGYRLTVSGYSGTAGCKSMCKWRNYKVYNNYLTVFKLLKANCNDLGLEFFLTLTILCTLPWIVKRYM